MLFCAAIGVWTLVHDVLLPKYSQQLNGVNVMSGPVFDEDFDGNVDPLAPTSGSAFLYILRELWVVFL